MLATENFPSGESGQSESTVVVDGRLRDEFGRLVVSGVLKEGDVVAERHGVCRGACGYLAGGYGIACYDCRKKTPARRWICASVRDPGRICSSKDMMKLVDRGKVFSVLELPSSSGKVVGSETVSVPVNVARCYPIAELHDEQYAFSGAIVRVIVPVKCKVKLLASGVVINTGESPLVLLGINRLEFSVTTVGSGNCFVVCCGDSSQKIRWLHRTMAQDPGNTESRFFSRTDVSVVLGPIYEARDAIGEVVVHGMALGKDGAVGPLPTVRTAVAALDVPLNWRKLAYEVGLLKYPPSEDDDDSESADDECMNDSYSGIGRSALKSDGLISTGMFGTSVVSTGSFVVTPYVKRSTPISDDVHPFVYVPSKVCVGFTSLVGSVYIERGGEGPGEGLTLVNSGEDNYCLDDGGPSDTESYCEQGVWYTGFPSEY